LPASLLAPAARALVPGQRALATSDVARKLEHRRAVSVAESLNERYRSHVAYWDDPASVVLGSSEPDYALRQAIPDALANDAAKGLSWLDLHWYLPDDILVKVDRAAMARSLETRVPMLDHRFAERALALASARNTVDGQSKHLLREILYRYVPPELVDRPKQGFAVPLVHWLRFELRDWAEALLDRKKLQEQGLWQPEAVRSVWDAHRSGRVDYSFQLWGVLSFQAWLAAGQE
jgi:asparagine synthase (glutamine-hydrolysing)